MTTIGDRIKVIGRIRPLNSTEISHNEEIVATAVSNQTIQVESYGSNIGKAFQLDAVLGYETTQDEVFSHIQPLLECSLEGFNCTIFTCE